MPKQQYPWLLAMTMLAAHQLNKTAEIDTEDTGPTWTNIIARLGRLQEHSSPSANDDDLAAALLILLFIWWWNCAKHRANLRVYDQNRAKYFQNNAAPFFPDYLTETCAEWSSANSEAAFFQPHTSCQMNSSLTVIRGLWIH